LTARRKPPKIGSQGERRAPPGWHAAVAQWGRASFLSLALALLDALQDLPLSWLATSQ
jgi:hypothetical protein